MSAPSGLPERPLVDISELSKALGALTITGFGPLYILNAQIRLFRDLKQESPTPSDLNRWLDFFLSVLSGAIVEKKASLSEDGKSLVSLLKSTCYQDAPDDCHSEDELKRLPRVEGEELLEAFRTSKDLSEFLEHKCFIRSAPDPESSKRKDWVQSAKFSELHKSFQTKFKGIAIEQLRGAFQPGGQYAKYNPDLHYGRTIAIVNSSGLGKSKLVNELGKQDLVLSICFREDESPAAGWPPGDRGATQFFDPTHESHHFRPEERCAAFYGTLCRVLVNTLELDTQKNGPSQLMRRWELTADTNGGTSRAQLFLKVKNGAQRALEQNEVELKRMSEQEKTQSSEIIKWYSDLVNLFMREPLKDLSNSMTELGFNRFFFAFDECGYLNQATDPDVSNKMSLIALTRIIKAIDGIGLPVIFWHFLLDTSSNISDISPQGKDAPSARLRRDSKMLPIWPYLTFDVMLSSRPQPKTARDTLRVYNYLYYGRPLWSTVSGQDLVAVADRKLFWKPFDPSRRLHAFAAFAQRLLLELAESSAASSIARDAVQKHMRILVYIENGVTFTECPSEPALAVAAACALLRSNETYHTAVETLINQLIVRGTVRDSGTSGELCTRLLLLIARDFATGPDERIGVQHAFLRGDPDNTQVVPVTLWELLSTLLGSFMSDLALFRDLKSWAVHVYLNFSHFIQGNNLIDKAVSLDYLEDLWCRGAAVQCAFNQPVIDGFLVGYCGELDKPFNKNKLIMIPWQTRRQKAAANAAIVNGLVCPFIFDGSSYHKPPMHLVLFMDLGTSTTFHPSREGLLSRVVELTQCRAAKSCEWGGYNVTEDVNRFCLNIRGHTATTYPVTLFQDTLFRLLFSRITGEEMDQGAATLLAHWNTTLARHRVIRSG